MDKLNSTKKSKKDKASLIKQLGEDIISIERNKLEIEEIIRKNPLQTASGIFIFGLIIGILIGKSLVKR